MDRQQQLLRRLLDLHERERKMIACEIHDGLAQQLTAALFTCDARFHRLASPLENALFRMAQETLANATRYSHSPKIELRLAQLDNHIVFEIRDWGVGFDPGLVTEDHFGLRGIRERARLLGGTAEVRSAPKEGTRIRVELPLIEAHEGDAPESSAVRAAH